MAAAQRHLVDFDLRRIPAYYTEVLVIGSGIAGLSAAIEASRTSDVLVVSKGKLGETNTSWAKGGIAAVLAVDDSFSMHEADTMEASQGLGEPEVIRKVVNEGPRAVEKLVSWGTAFDKKSSGEFDLAREGAHSKPRIVHAHGASTGLEIQRALIETTRNSSRIGVFEKVFVLDLLTNEHGECIGALGWSKENGFVAFGARQTILATGGGGQIYRETTNPEIATGDGLAIAYRTGAILKDLEFVQFHPTTLYIAGAARVLISEVVRGAGGVLRDRAGKAFMAGFHPSADLAPRDVVARAITRQMAETQDTNVYLDLSAIEGNVGEKFPKIAEVCQFFDIDIQKDPIPVRPGAHYFIGGVEVDSHGRTNIPRLFACGEVSCSGLHGANRIGSNSLLEGVVFGSAAGSAAAGSASGSQLRLNGREILRGRQVPEEVGLNLDDMTYSLKSVMGRDLGVERSHEGMDEAIKSLDFWGRYLNRITFSTKRGWELANMMTVARLIAECARRRTESRGVHFRRDFPDRNDGEWHRHSLVRCEEGQISYSTKTLAGAGAAVSS